MSTTTRQPDAFARSFWQTHRWVTDDCDVFCADCATPAYSGDASEVCAAAKEARR
jgi:hypothetical protein